MKDTFDTPSHPSIHPSIPSVNKTFSRFQKGRWKIVKKNGQVPTISLRGPSAIYANERRRREFWAVSYDNLRMDGWMDRTGYQKCPSIFIILWGYIDHVYMYLCIYSKIVTNIHMGFKIWCEVGGRGQQFQNYHC